MPKYVFVTDCPGGCCELTEEGLELKGSKTPKKGYSYRKVCREHGGHIIQRKVWCDTCRAVFYAIPAGKLSSLCMPCRQNLIRERSRAYKAAHLMKIEQAAQRAADEKKRSANCKNFDTLCGYCIREFFHCRAYKPLKAA